MLNIDGEDDPQITQITQISKNNGAHPNSDADAVWP
jgi:hypothetical protein